MEGETPHIDKEVPPVNRQDGVDDLFALADQVLLSEEEVEGKDKGDDRIKDGVDQGGDIVDDGSSKVHNKAAGRGDDLVGKALPVDLHFGDKADQLVVVVDETIDPVIDRVD